MLTFKEVYHRSFIVFNYFLNGCIFLFLIITESKAQYKGGYGGGDVMWEVSNLVLLPDNPPNIFNFTPNKGNVTSLVKINGNGFSSTKENNIVFFGTINATVLDATPNTITVIVPSNTNFENLIILNTENGLTGYSNNCFTTTYGDGKVDSSIYAVNQNLNTADYINGITMADIDGDGKLDIIATNDNKISIFENNSSWGILNQQSFSNRVDIVFEGRLSNKISINDINGDGKPEIITGLLSSSNNCACSGKIIVIKNAAIKGLINVSSFSSPTFFDYEGDPNFFAIQNIDSDGLPDLISPLSKSVQYFSILRNASSIGGDILFTQKKIKVDFNSGILDSTQHFLTGLNLGDINNKGKSDLIYTVSPSSVYIYKNVSSTNSFNFSPGVVFNTSYFPIGVSTADIDGDGKLDLITVNNNPNSGISILRNISDTSSNFIFADHVDFNPGLFPWQTKLADIDGDGKLDIITANSDDDLPFHQIYSFSILKNNATIGSININSFNSKVEFPAGHYSKYIDVGDLDDDGKPEVVIGNQQDKTLTLYKITQTSALPLNGISLNGVVFAHTIKLHWEVFSERQLLSYVIERSSNGIYFDTIGSQIPFNEIKDQVDYYFVDKTPFNGENFYRIKAISKNGQIQYSKIILIKYKSEIPAIIISPNPLINKTLNCTINKAEKGMYKISIVDYLGRIVLNKLYYFDGINHTFSIKMPITMQRGTYLFTFQQGNAHQTKVFVMD